MAIPTTRTKTKAEIRIDTKKCSGCGFCVSVCKDFGIRVEGNKARVTDHSLFGCIGCGHCMAVCPTGAVTIHGRTLSPDDLFDLPEKDKAATYAMMAGEALGLGTCMLGGVHPFIQSGKKAKEFRKKQGIRHASREGVFVIFGYPDVS